MRYRHTFALVALTAALTACSTEADYSSDYSDDSVTSASADCGSLESKVTDMKDMVLEHMANGTVAVDDPAYLSLKAEVVSMYPECTGKNWAE